MVMEGHVSADGPEPRLPVSVLDYRGVAVPVAVVIDTGFTGFMALPPQVIAVLGLHPARERTVRMADGRSRRIPSYHATIIWHGSPMTISAIAMPGSLLIGMSLLWNSDIAIAARENGRVTIAGAAEA